VRDAVPSEARDASLTLGRTDGVARQDKEGLLDRTKGGLLGRTKEGLLGRSDEVKRDFDSKGRFSSTAENVFQQRRIEEPT
jgi:hypothetical protein